MGTVEIWVSVEPANEDLVELKVRIFLKATLVSQVQGFESLMRQGCRLKTIKGFLRRSNLKATTNMVGSTLGTLGLSTALLLSGDYSP